MKKINNYAKYLVLLVIIFFYNCQNVDEKTYSCDPKINAWIIANKNNFSKFSRKEIADHKRIYQKAIMSTFSPEKKKEIWQEKVDYILTYDLSKEEMLILGWYAQAFKEIDYTKKTKLSEETEELMYQNALYGIKEFGWSNAFIYKTFFVVGDVDLTKMFEIEEVNANQVQYEQCDCNYDWGCGMFYGSCDEYPGGCTSAFDCGFFGNNECEEQCVGDEDEQQQ